MTSESNNEYQCSKCGYELTPRQVFPIGVSTVSITRFLCPNCKNNIYPDFQRIRRNKNESNMTLFIGSIVSFIASIILISFSSANSSVFISIVAAILFLGSPVVFVVGLFKHFVNTAIETKMKNLDVQYSKLFADTDNQKKASATNKILDDFLDKRKLWGNSFFEYPIKNIISNWRENADSENLKTIEDIALPLEEAIEKCLSENRDKSHKSIRESFYDNFVSSIKLELFEDYNVDFTIIDEEVRNLYNSLPVTLDYLESSYSSEYTSKYSKTEIKEEIQDELVDINNFYSLQLQEAKEILTFGISKFSDYDFETDVLRLDNLKYYPACQFEYNIDTLEKNYNYGDKQSVETYISRVLASSSYPIYVKKEFELEYNPENGILILNYTLPNINDIPHLSEINYNASKNSFKEVSLKSKELNELYDDMVYQIALRVNYEIFKSDKANYISTLIFNGWIQYLDGSDGLEKTACILSMQADKNEFLNLNLYSVEPKSCFKKFKGIGSSKLYDGIPVRPILNLNKSDRRFIEGYEVMNTIDETCNLASMDWKDFENLICELFEKEFSSNGGETRLTQSSRDAGVDVIAFDPDPIRGGKIVIQAKRYTNTVGVSAVRDLYGTVMNEGASRGLLICTSDYGHDSYEFAKNKPLTLLNGANLLHLLEKHGYKARIDLQEAKELQKLELKGDK